MKKLFFKHAMASREEKELRKPMVRGHVFVKSVLGIESYLSILTNAHDRFLITGFRLNLFHHLLASPPGFVVHVEVRGPCGCDNRSPQVTLHFVFLC